MFSKVPHNGGRRVCSSIYTHFAVVSLQNFVCIASFPLLAWDFILCREIININFNVTEYGFVNFSMH